LPEDKNHEWFSSTIDFAAKTWGAMLDDMSDGRAKTTNHLRGLSRGALSRLNGTQCEALLTGNTVRDDIGNLHSIFGLLRMSIESVSFYDANGPEASLTFSQATGAHVNGDPLIGSLLGQFDAAVLTIGPSGTQTYLPHIVMGTRFWSLRSSQQDALLVHELLHVILGSHEAIFRVLGVDESYIEANGGITMASTSLTNFLLGGCAK
jgi:hypothetical protein